MRKAIESILFAVLFIVVIGSFAQGVFAAQGTNPIKLTNPLGDSCNDLTCPLTAVINFLFTIAIPLCGILVLVGGFQMMMARGNPEDFSKGRKTILYAVVGFVVILLSGSVAALIRSVFGGQ